VIVVSICAMFWACFSSTYINRTRMDAKHE